MSEVRYDFAGRTAIVTGAAGGIGRATALAYAAAGANVVVADVQRDGGEETAALAERIGSRAMFVPCDVSSSVDVDSLMTAATGAFGRIDFACNNAGVELEDAALCEVDEAIARRVIDVNFTGLFLCMQREIRQFLAQGSGGAIVNMASMNAFRPRPLSAVYDGTKAAILALTRSAALSYAAQKIRINAVCPGVTDTPMLDGKMAANGLDKAMLHPFASLEKRLGTAEEVAAAVLWLSSDASSFVAGHALAVEGGYLLTGALPA